MRGKIVTPEDRERIIVLRKRGFSLPEISATLNIPKTTVLRYIKGVEILPEFLANWAGKRGGSKKRKLVKEKKAFEQAEALLKELSYREKLLFICALYWGEGTKGGFGLSNTDSNLIKIFMQGLIEVFDISKERFRISVRIYEDLNKEKCLDFWSTVVGIPKEKFVSINILQGKKKGKLEYGMCRIRITKGGDILKKIVAVNKVVTNIFVPIAQ